MAQDYMTKQELLQLRSLIHNKQLQINTTTADAALTVSILKFIDFLASRQLSAWSAPVVSSQLTLQQPVQKQAQRPSTVCAECWAKSDGFWTHCYHELPEQLAQSSGE